MIDYKNYTANDFIKDESFQQWVYTPDRESDAYWLEVLERHPELGEASEEARRFLLLFNTQEDNTIDARIGDLRKKIEQAIDAPAASASPVFKPDKRKKVSRLLYMTAASISFLLILSYVFLHDQSLTAFLFSHQQITPKGHRSLVTLEDGTRVWLNADSRLTYPKSFAAAKTREVVLEGEAYFDVTEDVDKPFVVQMPGIRVRVLGTSFNIRSYRSDDEIRTTLVKGKVIIEPSGNNAAPVTLLPRQQAVFEKRSKKITLRNAVDTEPLTSWREGKLIFDEQPLYVIIDELERWYNVTIHVEDRSSLSCRFSARINKETLEEVLELFKASDAIDYRMEGNEVFIIGRLCNE